MNQTKRILVTGAGGFIGYHLVRRLKAEGFWVRGVDIKNPDYEPSSADEFNLLDLRRYEHCLAATRGDRSGLQFGGGYGWYRLHNRLLSQHFLQQHANQRTHAGSKSFERSPEVSFLFFRLCLCAIQADQRGCEPTERRGRLSR